jgi:hypothetical protein
LALLDGDFGQSILDSYFVYSSILLMENIREDNKTKSKMNGPAAATDQSLEILKKLENRMRQNHKKSMWKNCFSWPVLDNLWLDFI